jgi:hypothetical protein
VSQYLNDAFAQRDGGVICNTWICMYTILNGHSDFTVNLYVPL